MARLQPVPASHARDVPFVAVSPQHRAAAAADARVAAEACRRRRARNVPRAADPARRCQHHRSAG
eukprot:1170145-Pleurochrysis_carterae.AAC.3